MGKAIWGPLVQLLPKAWLQPPLDQVQCGFAQLWPENSKDGFFSFRTVNKQYFGPVKDFPKDKLHCIHRYPSKKPKAGTSVALNFVSSKVCTNSTLSNMFPVEVDSP